MRVKFLLLFSLLYSISYSQTNAPSNGVNDANGWTSYFQGSMPLVISVPHGGGINLPDVKDRSCEGAVIVTDNNTKELSYEISEAFYKFYGLRPYLVVCNLVRKDVDQNREINEGTCGNALMEIPWNNFHNYIDTALAEAVRKYGACLYIDLHGHGHPDQRLELGYLINDKKLASFYNQEEILDAKNTSLRNLVSKPNQGTLRDMLFGPKAFGTLIAAKGFPAVPSQQDAFTKEGEKYFNGGYNTKRYTGPDYPNVFGWQIESNFKGVRDANGRPAFAIAFSEIIMQMLGDFSFIKMPVVATPQSK